MKKYIPIFILAAALIFSAAFVGCQSDQFSATDSSEVESGRVVRLDNGQLGVYFDVDVASMSVITTRSTDPEHTENTLESGWGFVFGPDTSTEDGYGDNSQLFQKARLTINAKDRVFFTFDDEDKLEEGNFFFRLMLNLTDEAEAEVEALVSWRMINAEGSSYSAEDISVFADYKHLSVGLDAFYQSAIADGFTVEHDTNSASHNNVLAMSFPMASPGMSIGPEINSESLTSLADEYVISLVRVGSKFDVTNEDTEKFTFAGATLLNGAMGARMRSTVVANDGVTVADGTSSTDSGDSDVMTTSTTEVIHSLSLPVNLHGTVTYGEVAAVDGSTAYSPVYFFPNAGDGPFVESDILEPGEEFWQDSYLSDQVNGNNPTYVIVRGTLSGYTEGYYKIPISYYGTTISYNENNELIYESSDVLTYDIVRNNHFHITLTNIVGPGYSTFDEAALSTNPASDISYSIDVNGVSDSRNETIVSTSGTFYISLDCSEIYAAGYGTDGVSDSFELMLGYNDENPVYDIPKVTITPSAGITIDSNATIESSTQDGTYTIGYTITQSGTITVSCGNVRKVIAVNYQSDRISRSGATLTVNGTAPFSTCNSIDFDTSYTGDILSITGVISSNLASTKSGGVGVEENYRSRECRANVYRTGGDGIARVMFVQASDYAVINMNKSTKEAITDGTNIFVTYNSKGQVYSVFYGSTAETESYAYDAQDDDDYDPSDPLTYKLFYDTTDKSEAMTVTMSDASDDSTSSISTPFTKDNITYWATYSYNNAFTEYTSSEGRMGLSTNEADSENPDEGYVAPGTEFITYDPDAEDNTLSISASHIGENNPAKSSSLNGYVYGKESTMPVGYKTITISNGAGESESYTIYVRQNTAPYFSFDSSTDGGGGVEYDEDEYGNTVAIIDNTAGDALSGGTIGNSSLDAYDYTVTVNNCYYNTGSEGDYSWAQVTSDSKYYATTNNENNKGGYVGGAVGYNVISATISPQASETDANVWAFYPITNAAYSGYTGKYQAFFVLTVTNDSEEGKDLYLLIRVDFSV